MSKKDRGVYEKVPGSGVWWIRWQDERKKIRRKKIGQKSKARIAVEQMRARVRLAVIAPELTAAPKRMTLKEAMQHVLETSTVSRRHRMYQHYYADRFNKEWPGALLADVTPASLETWMAKRRAQGVKPSTILHQLAFISKVFSVAVRNSWIAENPCSAIDVQPAMGFTMACPTCQAREGIVPRVFVGSSDGDLRVVPEKDVPKGSPV